MLEQFFAESRLRDLTALQKFSTVVFEPQTDGIVRRFEIVEVVRQSSAVERVTVRAEVAAPDGRVQPQTIDVVLERDGSDWRVTGFQSRP